MKWNELVRNDLWRRVGPSQPLATVFPALLDAAGFNRRLRAALVLVPGDGSLQLAASHWPAPPLLDRLPYRVGPATAAAAADTAAIPEQPLVRERLAPGAGERLGRWLDAGERLCARAEAGWPEPLSALFRGTIERGTTVAAAALPPILRAPSGVLVVTGGRGAPLSPGDARALLDCLLEPCALAAAVDPSLRPRDDTGALPPGDHDGLSERLIGAEGGLRFVMERVAIVAAAKVPVLILGETGSGKEVVARTIHERSVRARAPFVRVNCGAIAPELLDSELFGHERGAFTGAETRHRGWFERADTGTLLLDEVGELSAQAQVRLLRVLQDGELVRVGGEAPVRVDVRVIAATHRDLYAMVKDKAFREDLWYRLAVFPIHLPPLRDHVEDIPAMAEFFARRAATRFDLPVCAPTAADLALLRSYSWPGNVRELAAVMDRAVLLGQGRRLAIATALGRTSRAPAAPVSTALPPPEGAGDLANLDEAIRAHIERALALTGGRVDGPRGAARLLGVNPNTLRSRMRRMGIARHRRADAG